MNYWETNAGFYAMDRLIGAIGDLEVAIKNIDAKNRSLSFSQDEIDAKISECVNRYLVDAETKNARI